VQRIARAHGFQRSGRIIRDRVMPIAEHSFHMNFVIYNRFQAAGQLVEIAVST